MKPTNRAYQFLVCRNVAGELHTRTLTVYAINIGEALRRIWNLKGYMSCQYVARAYLN